jgi:hypothetical protein
VALTIACEHSSVVTLEEFIDHVHTNVDLRDMDSVAAAAPMFRGLANDRELVVRQLNRQVKEHFRSEVIPSVQALFLGDGRDFYVRANIWPSSADLASGRVYQDQFTYNMLHDHNYNFMTVSYHGPGYVTEIYEYDHDRVEGYVGEKVDLRFVERVHFTKGMLMLYHASVDVHTQLPPDDLAITLNFMISTPEVRLRDQYFFDTAEGTILEHPGELDTSRRISMVKMAGHVGNGETRQMLDDLAQQHPCRRTRLAASGALVRLEPGEALRVWERACADREPLVKNAAKKKLEELGG